MSASLFQAAKAAGRGLGSRGRRTGQVLVQIPQWTHLSGSTAGKAKPSPSRTRAIASLGQAAAQAEQPVQHVRSASRGPASLAGASLPFSQGSSARAAFR